MGYIAGRSVAVEHAHGRRAGVRELVEDGRRNVDDLAGGHLDTLFAETHFARAFDDVIDLFLLLVMPRHLAAVGLQRDVAHGEVGGLNGARATHQVLRSAPRGIGAAGDLREVRDDHGVPFRRRRTVRKYAATPAKTSRAPNCNASANAVQSPSSRVAFPPKMAARSESGISRARRLEIILGMLP